MVAVAEHVTPIKQQAKELGIQIIATSHSHVKSRRSVPEDLKALQADVQEHGVQLLYIQWHGDAQPGRRSQALLLRSYLLGLCQLIIDHD
eukprot:205079-Amphidinium_carterae.1